MKLSLSNSERLRNLNIYKPKRLRLKYLEILLHKGFLHILTIILYILRLSDSTCFLSICKSCSSLYLPLCFWILLFNFFFFRLYVKALSLLFKTTRMS